ncbi:MAG: magnesium transporter [Gammaproteobacteria bacterium]|nr:magnesium transporter [Gammaproteobacteria bacterium]
MANENYNERLRSFSSALESGTFFNVRRMLNGLHPAEIAHLLESLPPVERELLWELVDPALDGDVLLHVNDELRANLIRNMDIAELVAATEGLETDDLADFISDLPDTVIREVLQSMDEQNRHRLETVMSYPEDTAGGLMNTDTVTVRPDVTLDVVLRYLRLRGALPETTDTLFVVDRDDRYLGMLSLSRLITQSPALTVAEVMKTGIESINANMQASDVANLFEMHDLVSAPVIDDQRRLLGRITIDDVVDVIRGEAEHSMMSLTGIGEEDDMFAPVLVSARHRAVWLGINLLTAIVASWVIGLFQGALDKIVILAILMPIVASMGGIAGSQTLTLVIRGIALGQVGESNARKLLQKELLVGLFNGLLWALVIAAIVVLWFDNPQIGVILGAAIVINLLFAALAGTLLPMLLKRFGHDPALGGSVLLTTVTDVVGFMAFLGLATLFLL